MPFIPPQFEDVYEDRVWQGVGGWPPDLPPSICRPRGWCWCFCPGPLAFRLPSCLAHLSSLCLLRGKGLLCLVQQQFAVWRLFVSSRGSGRLCRMFVGPERVTCLESVVRKGQRPTSVPHHLCSLSPARAHRLCLPAAPSRLPLGTWGVACVSKGSHLCQWAPETGSPSATPSARPWMAVWGRQKCLQRDRGHRRVCIER